MKRSTGTNIEKYQHPILFYGLSMGLPWSLWFIAGYISHITPSTHSLKTIVSVLGLMGLISPLIIALCMIVPNAELRRDFINRVFNFKTVKPVYIFLTCFLMLASILLAQAISLLFGYSIDQFSLSQGLSFSAGVLPAWLLLLLAPALEELAWHSYGTDCLRARFNLFVSSMIFALFWAFWHMPLGSIKDYYQSNLVESGLLHSLNFLLSIFPFVLLMNWLYYKSNRNVLITIVFHVTAGVFNEIFCTHPDTKVIQTLLLTVLAIIIVLKEHKFFFEKEYY